MPVTPTLWGSNFQVNLAVVAGQQGVPAAASLGDGRSVIVWRDPGRSQSTLVFKIVNADGSAGSADTIVNGSQTSTGTIETPTIAAMQDGGFAIAWDYNNAGDRDIWAKTYNSIGAQTSMESIAHANTAGLQTYPSISAAPGGGFGLVWTDNNLAVTTVNTNTAIMQRYFGSTGVANTPAVRISDDYGGDFSAGFALSNNGTQAVAWDEDLGQVVANGENEGIFGVWGINNVPSAISASSGENDDTYAFPHVAFSGESFMSVWLGKPTPVSPYQIDARFNNGAFSAQVKVNTTTLGGFFNSSVPGAAAIAGNANGFLVVWSDGSAAVGGSDFDVLGQYFTFGGAAVGSEFVITSSAIVNNALGSLDVSATLDGRFLVTWTAGGPSTFGTEIFAQYVDPREVAQNWAGTSVGEQFAGTAFADVLQSQGGNDVLYGHDGADYLDGGADNDTLYGGNGADGMIGGNGNDALIGGTGDDLQFGQAGADTIYGEDGNDLVWGAGGDDALYGGEGNDALVGATFGATGIYEYNTLFAGGGNDTLFAGDDGASGMLGEAGNDLFFGGNGNDNLVGGRGNDTIYGAGGADNYFYYTSDIAVFEADQILYLDALDVIYLPAIYAGSVTFQNVPGGVYMQINFGAPGIWSNTVLTGFDAAFVQSKTFFYL